ncbi:Bug family tripartite tricarboxylate transporter substrate binding protein [Pseudoroseomonas ludipueritiae]|uniref:Tripartite tricarboxylate transporter substrate binding protein n=1 Tax=Pseudoroseomonas ludipueritiae TaxID=198093 RepID=A0ABR7R384_9PROT|nr:tripartite tricarboxylate transporter substrate-binding protein [Pseudoroseomonas ludipueritiae]MBC9176085.1 tripartite tricarboxylate transporter substrate binding protein [Pseudoroseomonas ludipueritiae]
MSAGISRRLAMAGAAGMAATLRIGPVQAQAYPARSIRMVVPFVPGGGADATARFVAAPLGAELGQSIVIENRGGAGGAIGTAAVAQAPADGYTLLYGTPGPLITNPILMPSLPYDAAADFAPVSLLTRGAYLMVVNRDVPARTVAEVIALAKSRPGQLSYANSGIGAGSHLAGELLCMEAGLRMTHVPYRGTGLAVQDVASGRVTMSIDTYGAMIPLIQAGNLRPIAVTSARRMPELPDVPTIGETLPAFEVTVVNYICVRSGTPRPIIDRLNTALVKVLADPGLKEAMRLAGSSPPVSSTPEELGEILNSESMKWRRVIDKAGIRVE